MSRLRRARLRLAAPVQGETVAAMNAPVAPKKRGAGFWILVIGGGLAVCCGGPVLLLIVAGVIGALSAPDGGGGYASVDEGAIADPDGFVESEESREEAPSRADAESGPDDFLYQSTTSGLQYIAPNEVVAEGVNVTLAGEWKDDHRNVVFRLHDSGRYELSIGGGALSGRTRSEVVASSSAEQGTWTFEGSTLTLTPSAYGLSGIAEGHSSSGGGQVDGPRQWTVVGVTIEYTPNGAQSAKQRPGLRVIGQSPSWYYPSGEMNWVLRRAW